MEGEERSKRENNANGHTSTTMPQEDYLVKSSPSDEIIPTQFPLIHGEKLHDVGKTEDGVIGISNYRVFLQHKDVTHHIPLGVIEIIECRDMFFLYLLCKDTKSFKCSFLTSETCLDWQKRISKRIELPESLEKVFAFEYYSTLLEENKDLHSALKGDNELSYAAKANKIFEEEIKRMGYDIGDVWRVSSINSDYKFCSTYPRKFIVPSSISDKVLESVAKFRMSRRIPAVVWRHSNGAVIARCSQPEVGWLGWRSAEDEGLVKAIAEACAYDSPSSLSSPCHSCTETVQEPVDPLTTLENASCDLNTNSKLKSFSNSDIPSLCELPEAKVQSDIKKVLIVDARSYTTAVANRARGGGCECPEYYNTCEIQFMNLANIHTVRKAHHALRQLTSTPADIPNWLSLLENSRWLTYISLLIKSAVTIAQAIVVDARPVLVHCSDGWDRTPQLTALAQLFLDPYYRTFQGFEVLVEREWIEFGHKFSDRCGCGSGCEDINERCPIFLQWLDCIHQVVRQFPTSFQFNQAYLVKLAQHVYSNLFGTFLSNSSQERSWAQLGSKTYSVWSIFRLNKHRYTNFLYSPTDQVLYPSFHTKDVELWKFVYMPEIENTDDPNLSLSHFPLAQEDEENCVSSELVKAKSCDNLLALNFVPNSTLVRRLSDPNIRDSCPNMALLQSAIGGENFDSAITQSNENTVDGKTVNNVDDLLLNINENELKQLAGDILEPSITFKQSQPSSNTNDKYDVDTGNSLPCETVCKDIAKRSIEGSTDTLVAELGVCDDKESDISIKNPTFEANKKVKESSPPIPNEETNGNVFFIKKISQKRLSKCHLNVADLATTGLANDEKTNASTSSGSCSFCLYNRKLVSELAGGSESKNVQENGKSNTVVNGGRSSHISTPGHSRTPSSCIPSTPSEERSLLGNSDKLFGSIAFVDGLSNLKDESTRKLHQIFMKHQKTIDNLKRQLQAAKALNHQLIHDALHHYEYKHDGNMEDEISLPESVGSGSAESSVGHESGTSDASWEAVEESGDLKPTLWVPDHAVDHCSGCHSQFWIGRRKHHCRSCGKIFCSECSDNSAPIPKENLYYPVRVCGTCFMSLFDAHKPRFVTAASN